MATSAEGTRVMVIEDVEEVREFFAQTLRKGGFHVVTAGDGAEALVLLGQTPADLIVLDLCLPDMDGRQLLQQLRVNPRTLGIPVVVVTGQPPALCAQLNFEGEHILYKPVAASRLLAQVELLLSQVRPRGVERPVIGVTPALVGASELNVPYSYAR